MGSHFFLDEGENTGTFLGRHFLERCDQFIDNFLEMLIPHEERHLTMLGDNLADPNTQ
jgi:hypothetical protein